MPLRLCFARPQPPGQQRAAPAATGPAAEALQVPPSEMLCPCTCPPSPWPADTVCWCVSVGALNFKGLLCSS